MRLLFNPGSSSCVADSSPAAFVATISTCSASGSVMRRGAGRLASADGSDRTISIWAAGAMDAATGLGPDSARILAPAPCCDTATPAFKVAGSRHCGVLFGASASCTGEGTGTAAVVYAETSGTGV